jgi:hypothetical protein
VTLYRKSCWRLTQLLILQTDTISQYKHSYAKIAAGDADTYSALVSAISYYGYYDASVALLGARAVILLAATADYTRRLGEVGACSAVTSIMSRHAQNASVQHWATRAVAHLAHDSANRHSLAGACTAVAAAVRAHSHDADVVQWGSTAVTNLAHNSDENRGKLHSARTGAAVVSSMQHHTGDDLVAVFALGCSDQSVLQRAQSAAACQRRCVQDSTGCYDQAR